MRKVTVFVAFAAAVLFFSPAAFACWSDVLMNGNNDITAWGDLNADFNSMAMIFMDSHPTVAPWCGPGAATRLLTRLQARPASISSGWLRGGETALAYAAALQLGPRGLITPDLDAELARLARDYGYGVAPGVPPCGFDNDGWGNGDTCMDNHLLTAAGYAWMTAYLRKTGRPWVNTKMHGVDQIQSAFSMDSICPHDPGYFDTSASKRGPCKTAPASMVISLNHSNQTPAYGLGLMTSLSAAYIGYDASDQPFCTFCYIGTDAWTYLQQMWTEGQLHTDNNGTFQWNCWNDDNRNISPPVWNENQQSTPCNDFNFSAHPEGTYFPVKYFYQEYGLPIPSPPGPNNSYMFDTFSDGAFSPYFGDRTAFFGAGRYAFYYILTKGYNNPGDTWPRPSSFSAGPDYYMGFSTQSGWYFSALNNGGSDINANVTWQLSWESLYLHDNNLGTLTDGDQVSIRTTSGWYFSADQGGGGGLYANRTSPNSWETFTVVQIGGGGVPLGDGALFALRTADGQHYVSATNGGGSTVNATATSIGPNETFVFHHVADYPTN